jgi:hypothetical protein
MSNESKIGPAAAQAQSRRAFVKTAAQVAVTAPAAVMLLNASAKPAKAATELYHGVFDDFSITEDDADSSDLLIIVDDFPFGP